MSEKLSKSWKIAGKIDTLKLAVEGRLEMQESGLQITLALKKGPIRALSIEYTEEISSNGEWWVLVHPKLEIPFFPLRLRARSEVFSLIAESWVKLPCKDPSEVKDWSRAENSNPPLGAYFRGLYGDGQLLPGIELIKKDRHVELKKDLISARLDSATEEMRIFGSREGKSFDLKFERS